MRAHLPGADGSDVVQGLEHPLLEAPSPRGGLGLVKQPENAEALFASSLWLSQARKTRLHTYVVHSSYSYETLFIVLDWKIFQLAQKDWIFSKCVAVSHGLCSVLRAIGTCANLDLEHEVYLCMS